MPTFARGYWTAKVSAHNKRIIDRSSSTTEHKITWRVTAGNEATLRGIPAIGRGVSGHIPGTRPDSAT